VYAGTLEENGDKETEWDNGVMAWSPKQRGPTSGYYYRSRRIDGKPRKIYLGRHAGAQAAAALVAQAQMLRVQQRAARQAAAFRLAVADDQLGQFRGVLDLLVRATLVSGGYYQHHGGGAWRRRGMTRKTAPQTADTGSPASNERTARTAKAAETRARKKRQLEGLLRGEVPGEPSEPQCSPPPNPPLRTSVPPPLTRDDAFRELLARANQGDRAAVSELRRHLDANPEIWRRAGDLATHVEQVWIDLLAGGNWLVAEGLRRHVDDLRQELSGSHPTRLEDLLVRLVTTTWLTTQHAALAASAAGGNLDQAAYKLKRSEIAEKRFLAAARQLATLRALVPHGLAPLDALRPYSGERQRA